MAVNVRFRMNKKLKMYLYTICWNEEIRLPYFIRHYKQFVDKIIIYDNGSTDKTLDIIRSFPDLIELRTYDTGGEIRNDVYLKIKNNCWKESRGIADFVIVCDMDELLYYDKDIHKYLQYLKENNFTLIEPAGYRMIGDFIPTTEKMIYDEIKFGIKDEQYNKLCMFNPNEIQEINYEPGCHIAHPIGNIKVEKFNFKLLHFKWLSLEYVIQRNKQYRKRHSKIDKKHDWGIHHKFSKRILKKTYYHTKEVSIQVIKDNL